MNGSEYGCDRCGEDVPNGAGHYRDDDRLCRECFDKASPRENVERIAVCGDCLYMAANGAPDYDGYDESGHAERYAQACERHGFALESFGVDAETGELWQDPHFSWSPCQWCGDTFGGSRYYASVGMEAGSCDKV